MKNIKYILILLLATSLFSCDDEDITKINIDEYKAPVVESSLNGTSYVLKKDTKDDLMVELKWSAANFSFNSAVKYDVLIDIEGNDFKDPILLKSVNSSTDIVATEISQEEFNNWSKLKPLAPEAAHDLEVQIIASVHEDVDTLRSEKITLTVTTYLDVIPSPQLYIVGDACAAGWDAANAIPLYKKEQFSTIFTYLEDSKNFRFLGQQGWNPLNYNYGTFETKPDYLTDGGGGDRNFGFHSETGIYKVVCDFDKSILTLEKTDYEYDIPSLYLVGTINGWDADNAISMTKNGDVFTHEMTLPDNAEFKFIGQQAWAPLEYANIKEAGDEVSNILGHSGNNNNIKFNGGDKTYIITASVKGGYFSIVENK